jgi:hypothetical protein
VEAGEVLEVQAILAAQTMEPEGEPVEGEAEAWGLVVLEGAVEKTHQLLKLAVVEVEEVEVEEVGLSSLHATA